jgi:hypothetical protein
VFSAVFCTFACSNLTIGCLSNFRQDQPIWCYIRSIYIYMLFSYLIVEFKSYYICYLVLQNWFVMEILWLFIEWLNGFFDAALPWTKSKVVRHSDYPQWIL